MANTAYKRKDQNQATAINPLLLVDVLDGQGTESRSWFFDFLKNIFDSPDYDLSQFERLENKRTRHQIELGRFY